MFFMTLIVPKNMVPCPADLPADQRLLRGNANTKMASITSLGWSHAASQHKSADWKQLPDESHRIVSRLAS